MGVRGGLWESLDSPPEEYACYLLIPGIGQRRQIAHVTDWYSMTALAGTTAWAKGTLSPAYFTSEFYTGVRAEERPVLCLLAG